MKWPSEAAKVRLIAKNANKVRKAFKASIDGDAIAQSWAETHPAGGSVSPQTARDWARTHAITNKKPMQNALAGIYADGYVFGEQTAKAHLSGLKKAPVSVQVTNWSTWKPGNPSAAALVKPRGGLRSLLASRKITIADEVINTKLDRIGTALSTALKKGFGARETAQMIDTVINDPEAAMVIARTETARAVSIATRDEYEKNNVQQVEWIFGEEGTCEICADNADASPIGIGDTFPSGDAEPPAHPNCMCTLVPYYEDLPEESIDETALEEPTVEDLTVEDLTSEDLPVQESITYDTEEMDIASEMEANTVNQIVSNIRNRAKNAEPAITDTMKSVANKVDADLSGLKFKLKSAESLKRKVLTDAVNNFDGDLQIAAQNISDAVRYTMLSEPARYMEVVNKAIVMLEKLGYRAKVKNYWEMNSSYKGINVALTSPTGQKTELQFHTPESLDVKDTIHKMYEKYRVLDANSREAQLLYKKMKDISDKLQTPPKAK